MDPAMLAALLGAKGKGKGDGKGGPGGPGGAGGYDPSGGLAGLLGPNVWENPFVANIAFHPSKGQPKYENATSGPMRDGVFGVSGGDKVSYRLYLPPGDAEVVVYFWHGNAEVCTALDDVKDVFHGVGAAVLSLDYRGYSWGTGQPSLTKLCADAEACFSAGQTLLAGLGLGSAKVVTMGRSIGATCAVHIAAKRASRVSGLVVDSGLMSIKGLPMVASMGPMLLGGPEAFAGLAEPFDTLGKLAAISCPLLVMHGKRDEIVPFAQASECHERCASRDKTFKEWETAGHNDVSLDYGSEWAAALVDLLGRAKKFSEPFPAGALVETHSLSEADMNGLQGRVLGPQSGDRYRVALPAPVGEKALKAENLKVLEEAPEELSIGSRVEAHSLSATAFNGLQGIVLGPKGEDRLNVEFPEPHGVKALKPANLKLVKE